MMTEASKPLRKEPQTGKAQEKSMDATVTIKSETPSTTAEARTAALKARKRTKTGCLTCRKRRIKCGEERPTCKNCIKSKRDCEGYIPRVIFKDPLGAFRPGQQGIAARNSSGSNQNGTGALYGSLQPAPADLPIAPRLPSYAEGSGYGPISTSSGHNAPAGTFAGTSGHTYGNQYYTVHNGPSSSTFPPQQYTPKSEVPHYSYLNGNVPQSQVRTTSHPTIQHQSTGDTDSSTGMSPPNLTTGWSHASTSSSVPSAEFSAPLESPSVSMTSRGPQNDFGTHVPESPLGERKPSFPSYPIQAYPPKQIVSQNQYYGLPPQTPWRTDHEDEYYDVDSEDNSFDMKPEDPESSYDLGRLIAMSASHSNGGHRTMNNFLDEPNVLATYVPTYAASPLMDRDTARVFCHFITATAPTLQVCERHPSNPSIIFSGLPVPKSQRALWSYTMPMLALTHQGLLHAMLALGSLHIAKLQETSPTPSLKHYHYALRRVAKALGNQTKRKNVATLAATLLLGFYEITTAEHNKWNSHLSGARELIMDIDFAGMAKRIEKHKRQQEEAETQSNYAMHNGTNGYYQPYYRRPSEEFASRQERQLDENLISTLMGKKLKYNQYGQVFDGQGMTPDAEPPPTTHEIELFEIRADLFWWYAKQDMYQGLVSGNRLLLSYDRWSLCPPRAPVGRLDAVYGSLDHLLLLMGRMADFAARDLSRKLRAQREAERKGPSHSSPPNLMRRPSQPAQQGPPMTPNSTHPSASPMYGYMPNPGSIRVPRGFDQAKLDQNYGAAPVPMEGNSLEAATLEAEAEWSAISNAFDVYANSLGPAFAPLGPEHMTPIATPFGPALYYRSWSIACVLTMYYVGRIVCQRIKPNMPPAAMAAAGFAAQSTAQYANTIGRICAGIQPVDASIDINPHHGAALMDCCMGLFQAGIQYRDPGQRGWTITKLRDIARLTGWQTSSLIASGCERAWMKAAEMGRGPPYVTTMNWTAKDDRVSGRGRDSESMRRPPKDNNDRRFIASNAGTRVYWATGILGTEEDMKAMKLD